MPWVRLALFTTTALITATIVSMALFLVSEHTRLDLEIARRLYDPELGRFPLRHQWLLDTVLYHGMKQASSVAVAGALYFCYLGWKGELAWLPALEGLSQKNAVFEPQTPRHP